MIYAALIGAGTTTLGRGIVGGTLTAGVLLAGITAAAVPDGPVASPAAATMPAVRADASPRRVSVMAAGDVLTESRVRASAAAAGASSGKRFDFEPMFGETRELLESADLAICNMELPIGTEGGPFGNSGRSPFGGNRLLAPYEVAEGLRAAGFDRCSTASNHANDLGDAGIESTIDALHANDISTVGTARSLDESHDTVFSVAGVALAHLSYTTYSNTVRPSDGWRMNYSRSASTISQAVRRVRTAGAEIVVVSLHVSKELGTLPTADDRSLVTDLIGRGGVDAVFVHGPHVVQPVEIVSGVPVWWSLGNFVSEMGPPSAGRYASPRTSDGLLAHVRFVDAYPDGFIAQPTSIAICNDFADRTVRSATAGLGRGDLSVRVRSELQACLDRTRALVPDAR